MNRGKITIIACSLWFSFVLCLLTGCQPQQEKTLKLMSYNIRNGIGLDEVVDYQRVAAVIAKESPMVVALQEVDSVTGRSKGVDVLALLAQETQMYPTYAAAIPFDGGKYGVGILSKEKPLSVRRLALPGREEARVFLLAEFDDYLFACTHLSLTTEDRMASLPLIREVAQAADKPFFMAGDWNDDPQSSFIQDVMCDFVLLTDTTECTFPADKPDCCIDYIAGYTAKNASFGKDTSYVCQEPLASDHRPIVSVVHIKH